jgi:hypothetical protein
MEYSEIDYIEMTRRQEFWHVSKASNSQLENVVLWYDGDDQAGLSKKAVGQHNREA